MEFVKESERKTPIIGKYDVVVVGGGVAGIVSSIAAARNGAKVALIEQYGFLGGTATAGLMACINGFRNQRKPNHVQTVRGIAQEFIMRMRQLDGVYLENTSYEQETYDIDAGELPYCVGFDPEVFKYVAIKMVLEAGAELYLHTYALEAIVDGVRIEGVIVHNKSGRQAIMANVIIDASGDGDIAASAGAPFVIDEENGHMMKMTQMFRLANLDLSRLDTGHVHGILIKNTYVSWGGTVSANGIDADSLTRAEVDVREQTWEKVRELKKLPGFEDALLIETATHVGVRETRRFVGEYTLTEADARDDVRFDDVIAISSNPVPAYYGYRYYYEHLGFDVPYRCVVPKKIDNLLLAGRNISMEQPPFQSARSMAPNMAIAQAVGTAAALCIGNGVRPRDLDVKELQAKLSEQGAVISR
ncbi:MAG: FAD-dependent oxidoreductase [Firmicutes bacterium]|nr:FAD-dependent oxidoreductase [Bacillota bacterium]